MEFFGHQLFLSITCFLLFSHLQHFAAAQGVGVTLARQGNVPCPKDIVKLVLKNEVHRVRIYDGYKDRDLVEAFRNQGLEVMVGVGNQDVIRIARGMAHGRPSVAIDWLKDNIQPYADEVAFRCILVGGNDMAQSGLRFMAYAYQALVHLQKAMEALGLHIPLAVEVDQRILSTTFPPSAAEFDGSTLSILRPILNFIHYNSGMLVVDIYPMTRFLTDIEYDRFPPSYALCRAAPSDWGYDDGGRQYNNMMDSLLDAYYTALEKAGIERMVVMVGETGWPSEGEGGVALATSAYAADYINHIVARLKQNKGTPLRSWPVETYLHTLYVQDKLSGEKKAYGLYYPNGTMTYPNVTLT